MVFVCDVLRLSIKLSLALFFASLLFTVSDGFCYDGCKSNQVCCDETCFYGSSCLGLFCSYDFDCSSGESCCKNLCVNGSSCFGHRCGEDSDCSYNEACCNQKCKFGFGCVGHSCGVNSDCGNGEQCCSETCHLTECPNISPIAISSIVVSILILLVILVVALISAYRRNRSTGVLLGQTIESTTAAQIYQPYQAQTPPPYQESYPHYHPPKYEQYPPTKASEPPPSYNTEQHGRAAGVYTPQASYGTLPNPATLNV